MNKILLGLLLLAPNSWGTRFTTTGDSSGQDLMVVTPTQVIIVKEVAIGPTSNSVSLSSSGFDSTRTVVFSSNVVISGDLRVNSTKAKAIFLPTGGIHIDDGENVAATAPGQMFSKKIRTSTITLVGSAIVFENAQGVEIASMTATKIVIDNIESKNVSSGKIRNANKGSGAPAAGDCTAASDGLQYLSKSPAKLWLCVDSNWYGTPLNP